MFSIRSALLVTACATLLATPHALRAQAAPATPVDSLAFPRQFVKWVFIMQGDSAFAHAGTLLREGMKNPDGVSALALRIAGRFGELQSTDAEVQFDEGDLKVYIAAMHFTKAPDAAGWLVAYSPKTGIVERANFTSLATFKSRYPQAKLP